MWLKAAIFCGGLPLVTGLALCGLYLTVATDKGYESAWMAAGLGIIFVGMAFFGLGLIALCVYFFKGRKTGLEMRKLVENCVLALLLLFSNFPVALACTWVANQEMSAYRLHFTNESTEALEQLLVTWPGDKAVIDELQPGESYTLVLHTSGDGAVSFNAMQGGESCEGILVGYVTPNLGGQTEVAFIGDCEIEITER